MDNLPEVSQEVIQNQAYQYVRAGLDEQCKKYLKEYDDLGEMNPHLQYFIDHYVANVFSVKNIDMINRHSKNPEEFAKILQDHIRIAIYTTLKIIDAQIDVNVTKDMYK